MDASGPGTTLWKILTEQPKNSLRLGNSDIKTLFSKLGLWNEGEYVEACGFKPICVPSNKQQENQKEQDRSTQVTGTDFKNMGGDRVTDTGDVMGLGKDVMGVEGYLWSQFWGAGRGRGRCIRQELVLTSTRTHHHLSEPGAFAECKHVPVLCVYLKSSSISKFCSKL